MGDFDSLVVFCFDDVLKASRSGDVCDEESKVIGVEDKDNEGIGEKDLFNGGLSTGDVGNVNDDDDDGGDDDNDGGGEGVAGGGRDVEDKTDIKLEGCDIKLIDFGTFNNESDAEEVCVGISVLGDCDALENVACFEVEVGIKVSLVAVKVDPAAVREVDVFEYFERLLSEELVDWILSLLFLDISCVASLDVIEVSPDIFNM